MTSYKLPCIITRGNNVYGPHQFPEKLIPKMTLLASRGKEMPVHGDGKAVRSYLHVRDVARAFDTVLHKGVVGQVYNIGTQKERSVLEVIEAIAKHLGVGTEKIKHVEDRAFNDQRCGLLLASSCALRKRLRMRLRSRSTAPLDCYTWHSCCFVCCAQSCRLHIFSARCHALGSSARLDCVLWPRFRRA